MTHFGTDKPVVDSDESRILVALATIAQDGEAIMRQIYGEARRGPWQAYDAASDLIEAGLLEATAVDFAATRYNITPAGRERARSLCTPDVWARLEEIGQKTEHERWKHFNEEWPVWCWPWMSQGRDAEYPYPIPERFASDGDSPVVVVTDRARRFFPSRK